MLCSTCKRDNPADASFCEQCGSKLELVCPACKASVSPGARFCKKCGAAIGGPAAASTEKQAGPQIRVAQVPESENLEGERKTVTALFADIKGSTELEQDLDPEEARAIIDPALKLMIDAARRYDGYVVQSTGDGIFVLFGAPVAHEDHPQRALYAAIRMQEELKRYSARLRESGNLPLEARVGVNTGEVVVRLITTGEGHTEYTPIGHTTNLASRMQALAPTGSIAISEQTRKFVEGYFQLKPLGPTRVKGVSEPVNVYEVTGLGPLRTRLQRSVGRGLTKFVGREREMEALKHAAGLAREGHGQIAAAVAEAGTGKSRLYFEFKAISQSGWMVFEAFSVSHGKASAYLPVIDLLHSYFGIASDDDARKRRERVAGKIVILDRLLEDTLPYLYALLAIAEDDDPLSAMDVQVRRRRTLDAVKRILLRESLNQPLMVIFEDLHWIDDETQALLNLLADSIANAKILLLVNYRPEYSHQWNSKTYYTQLRLDPLGKESAEEMLAALLGSGKDLIPLKRMIIERTEGTPFFMEEIVQALFDDGILQRNGRVKLTRSMNAVKVPVTVQGVLAARIDRLPADEKELLQTLGVLGREFRLGLVRSVALKADDDLARMLSELQLAEFIYEQPAVGDTEYIFKHALTQEVTYNSLLIERRKLLHGRVGAALEAIYADNLVDHVAELAHHYSHSSNIEKKIEYAELAGHVAMKRGALKDAERYFKEGIAALNTTPETPERAKREFNLQYALSAALQNTSGITTDETFQLIRRLRELSESLGTAEQRERTLLAAWAPTIGRGKVTEALQMADQLQRIAEQRRDTAALSVAHSFQEFSRLMRGELVEAMQHGESAIATYNEAAFSGEPNDSRVVALSYMGTLLWHLGTGDRGLAKTRESISLAERLKNPWMIAIALESATMFYLDLREPGGVEKVAEKLSSLAIEQQLPAYFALASVYRGWAMAEQGLTDEGIALIRRGIDSAVTFKIRWNMPVLLGALSEAQVRAGDNEEALASIEQAVSAVGEMQCYLPGVLWRRGELQLKRQNETEAADNFRETLTVARRIGSKAYELRATTSLARLLDQQGHRDEARTMLADIYNWFTEGFDTADLKDAKALLDELSR